MLYYLKESFQATKDGKPLTGQCHKLVQLFSILFDSYNNFTIRSVVTVVVVCMAVLQWHLDVGVSDRWTYILSPQQKLLLYGIIAYWKDKKGTNRLIVKKRPNIPIEDLYFLVGLGLSTSTMWDGTQECLFFPLSSLGWTGTDILGALNGLSEHIFYRSSLVCSNRTQI